MNKQIIRDAIRAFPKTELTSRSRLRHNRREYIKARLTLGDRWILATKIAHKNRDAVVCASVCVLSPVAIAADLLARGL